jgi:hypothetical protein
MGATFEPLNAGLSTLEIDFFDQQVGLLNNFCPIRANNGMFSVLINS